MKVSTSACRWSFRLMYSLRNRSSQKRMNSSVTLGFASFSSAMRASSSRLVSSSCSILEHPRDFAGGLTVVLHPQHCQIGCLPQTVNDLPQIADGAAVAQQIQISNVGGAFRVDAAEVVQRQRRHAQKIHPQIQFFPLSYISLNRARAHRGTASFIRHCATFARWKRQNGAKNTAPGGASCFFAENISAQVLAVGGNDLLVPVKTLFLIAVPGAGAVVVAVHVDKAVPLA